MALRLFKRKSKKEDSRPKERANSAKEYRRVRRHLTEKQIDRMIDDSFPASDPPSTY